jgi:hypothetical protein
MVGDRESAQATPQRYSAALHSSEAFAAYAPWSVAYARTTADNWVNLRRPDGARLAE